MKWDTFMAKELVAMLLAGGQGSRLYALTQKLAKPAVPFGFKRNVLLFPVYLLELYPIRLTAYFP